ncbi:MAG TPA: cell division protein FtsW [Bacteroidales bacterium]|nr:cell division protein FtsW [Bacteroidales bacterium]
MNNFGLQLKGDRVIWGIYIIFSMISLAVVYSASGHLAYKLENGNAFHYLFKQLGIVVFGFFVMYLTHRIKYHIFSLTSVLLIWLVIPILIFTIISGTNINNASRWLMVPGINISFQSSDFAKVVLLTFLARNLSRLPEKYKENKNVLRYVLIQIFTPTLLVTLLILQSNFSTAFLIFSSAFFMMMIGNVKPKYLFGLAGSGIVILGIAFLVVKTNPNILPRFDTWVNRIENFTNTETEDDYQVLQSKIAIASNPLIGKLPGKSIQRAFLPSAQSDFIFAIIIEEYGTIIGFFVPLLYLVLFFRALVIAKHSTTIFGALLALGLTFTIVIQAMLNMSVAVNLVPVTGQPLPLLSSGGSSFVFTSMALGMIQSVSAGSAAKASPSSSENKKETE